MVEQVAQESLVRTTYFISPEYMSILRQGEGGDDDTFHTSESYSKDDRDTIHYWLKENTIGNKLMGENGVWCEVGSIPVYDKKRREQIGETTRLRSGHRRWRYNEPYNLVVRVKTMPSSRELPPELLEVLTERKYKEIESDDKFLEKSYGVKKSELVSSSV